MDGGCTTEHVRHGPLGPYQRGSAYRASEEVQGLGLQEPPQPPFDDQPADGRGTRGNERIIVAMYPFGDTVRIAEPRPDAGEDVTVTVERR